MFGFFLFVRFYCLVCLFVRFVCLVCLFFRFVCCVCLFGLFVCLQLTSKPILIRLGGLWLVFLFVLVRFLNLFLLHIFSHKI